MLRNNALQATLAGQSREAELYVRLPNDRVRCFACGHRCVVLKDQPGICQVRFNRGGRLYVPWGYVAGLQCDPIEKKPFFHALPGSQALSFGMLGCNFHCGYCQNWITSQTLRDPGAIASIQEVGASEILDLCSRFQAQVVTSTYNEPLITSEWAVEIFKMAKNKGFKTAYVSNGNGTPEVIDYLQPWLDLCKIDLKSFQDRNYRKLGGRLSPVLDTIRRFQQKNVWVEIVTLVVPGFNDSDEELSDIARFIVSVSPNIPWHVTAFHQDYKMTDRSSTSIQTLLQAAEIGQKEGLRYVYAGNLSGRTSHWENTYCPGCRRLLIERFGFRVLKNEIDRGACPHCHAIVPGIWE